ncbi:MAG: hypothetical protein ACI4PL_02240 [Faecousia sp.]
MTREKSGAPGFFTMGAPLLLTALLVLMFVTFSLLRLSSAREELRRGELLASRNQAYYTACNQAEYVLDRLTHGEDPGTVLEAQGETLRFRIPMDENQSLSVTARRKNGIYTVESWTVENN